MDLPGKENLYETYCSRVSPSSIPSYEPKNIFLKHSPNVFDTNSDEPQKPQPQIQQQIQQPLERPIGRIRPTADSPNSGNESAGNSGQTSPNGSVRESLGSLGNGTIISRGTTEGDRVTGNATYRQQTPVNLSTVRQAGITKVDQLQSFTRLKAKLSGLYASDNMLYGRLPPEYKAIKDSKQNQYTNYRELEDNYDDVARSLRGGAGEIAAKDVAGEYNRSMIKRNRLMLTDTITCFRP